MSPERDTPTRPTASSRLIFDGRLGLSPDDDLASSRAVSLIDDFAKRNPRSVERRGGGTYIAPEVAAELIDEAESRGVGVLGMEGFIIGDNGTYPSLSRIADFSMDGANRGPDFVSESCSGARRLLLGPWSSPPAGDADQVHPEAKGRYMIDFVFDEPAQGNGA